QGVAAGNNINWAQVSQDVGNFGVANSIKTGLIEMAGETSSLTKATANYLKVFKTAGVVGSVVTTAYSGYNVHQQYEQGGITEVMQHRDVLDAAVGVVGLAGTGLAYFGIISNPVGWAIGAGVLTYYIGTMIYDYYNP